MEHCPLGKSLVMESFNEYTLLTCKRSGKICFQTYQPPFSLTFKLHCVFQQLLFARQTTCNNIKNASLKVCLTSLGLSDTKSTDMLLCAISSLKTKEEHKRPSELGKISITNKWKIERKPCWVDFLSNQVIEISTMQIIQHFHSFINKLLQADMHQRMHTEA